MTTSANTAIAVLDNFTGAVSDCPPDLNYPQIWRLDKSGEWVEYPHTELDIYTAIFQFSTRHQFGIGKPVGDAFVCRTIGWGAPLDENGEMGDTPPSERRDRFRVALDICATPTGAIASRLSFQSGEKAGEVIDDTGEATGQLAQAVDLAAFRVWGRAFTSALLMDYTTKSDDMTETQIKHLAHRVGRFLDVLNDGEDWRDIVSDNGAQFVEDLLNRNESEGE